MIFQIKKSKEETIWFYSLRMTRKGKLARILEQFSKTY
jgi:hypothetical protein